MKQIKTPTTDKTISDAIAEILKIAQEKDIKGFAFVGVYETEKPDDSVQSFFFGIRGREPQIVGALEIAKRDVLSQIPTLQKGEL